MSCKKSRGFALTLLALPETFLRMAENEFVLCTGHPYVKQTPFFRQCFLLRHIIPFKRQQTLLTADNKIDGEFQPFSPDFSPHQILGGLYY